MSDGARSVKVGAEGSVWADDRSLYLVRLAARAVEFPAGFSVNAAARTIDYASVRIGARDVLMPVAVEDLVETVRGARNMNRSRFGQCREYSATSSLTFDTAPPPQSPAPLKASIAELP